MDDVANQYRIWSEQMTIEGPVELPALVAAIKAHRVKADSWLYLDHEKRWIQAAQVPELKMFFGPPPAGAVGRRSAEEGAMRGIKPGTLRRIKLFADLEEEQLEVFLQLMEVLSFKQFATVVKAGEHSDAMYLVLEGELRARNLIDGRETILATMSVGDFFGEVALLDHGPRSADVVANVDSVLLKISAASVERLVRESPSVAAPFLQALSRAIVGRMRVLLKKYQDSIHFSRIAGAAG